MTLQEVIQFLKAHGSEQTKKVLRNHGAKDPFFGVKVADLKILQKKIKLDYELSKALYKTGNSDAMYLAGLIADPQQMTKQDLNEWVKEAYWYMLSDYTVAWVTSESQWAIELALEWIESDKEFVASAGWSTLASYCSITPDENLDITLFEKLLNQAAHTITDSMNRVKYAKNNFIIACGCYVPALTNKALELSRSVGKVEVSMGNTSCKVPLAETYILKVQDKGKIGKKRKKAIC